MRVAYSVDAINDLNRLVEFIESKNPYAARRLAVDLQEAIQKLKSFPAIGLPVESAKDPSLIRDLYVRDYTVRYLLNEQSIYVLRVWHNKENEKD